MCPGGTSAKRPRAQANVASGNPTRRKHRKRTGMKGQVGSARIGVKRRLLGLPEPVTKSRRRMTPTGHVSLVGSPQPRNAASPAHLAPMPMSRKALEYMQAMGLLTPTRLSRILVLGTPQRANPPPAPSMVPPAADRAIPPGIERMLRQIQAPSPSPPKGNDAHGTPPSD